MSKRKNLNLNFKRDVLHWIYEDEANHKTLYAAEKHFNAVGHLVNKQSIQVWM